MKDSGVPWLGEVPEHWATERAKWLFGRMSRPVREADEVITCFRDGVVTLRKNRRTSGFTESLKEIGYQGIRRGDLVIHAMDAFAGSIGVSDSDGKGTPVYLVCSPKASANSRYYAYAVREMAASQWIQAHAKGIRERSTDFRYEAFGTQEVPLPPLPEQEAIVRFLDHAEGRIRRYIGAKQRLVKLLEEQRQAIVHQAVTRGLDPTVPLKPSGIPWLGDIPAHWDVRPLKRWCDINRRTLAERTSPDFEFAYVDIGTVGIGVLVREPERVTFGSAPSRARRVVQDGDTIVSTVRTYLKATYFVETAGETMIASTGFAVLSPRRLVVPRYLAFVVESENFVARVSADSIGIAYPAIAEGRLGAFHVALPPVEEQERILTYLHAATAPFAKATERARREIELLREYRTRLIADVVTGKVDVRAHPWANTEPEPGDLQTLADLDDSDADRDEALLESDGAGDDER